MKIGILTYHRAHNYGAVLQCYALQETLKKLGADVHIIDYKQPHIDWVYKPKYSIKHIIKLILTVRLNSLYNYLHLIKKLFNRKKNFESFRNKYLNCTEECKDNIPQDFDRFVIGSDQVWGIHCTKTFDKTFWGDFKRKPSSKLYGYAVSSNGDYHQFLSNQELYFYINLFDNITFREEKIQKDIEVSTGINKGISLDPTLLTDEIIWKPLLNNKWNKNEYVVVYQIRRLHDWPTMLESKAQQYAEKYKSKVVNLSGMYYPIEDFISLIKNAQCVFTSSFHATVFSIIFGTPFYSFLLYDGHDERYQSLLQKLKLSKHLVDKNSETNITPYISNIDETKKILTQLKAESLNYLKEIVH